MRYTSNICNYCSAEPDEFIEPSDTIEHDVECEGCQ